MRFWRLDTDDRSTIDNYNSIGCPSSRHHALSRSARRARARPAARAAAHRQSVCRPHRRAGPSELAGRTVVGLRRIGKRIVLALDGDLFVVVHLMIAGRLRWQDQARRSPARSGWRRSIFRNGTLILTEAGSKRQAVDSPRRRRRGGSRARSAAASRCSMTADLATFAAALAARESHPEARADRSAPLQRHRQRLLGRDPARGAALADEADAARCPTKRSRGCSTRRAPRSTRGSSGCAHEARRRFRRRSRRFATGWPCTVATASPVPTAARPCSGSSTPRTRPTTAARCQTGGRLLADRALSRLLKDDWPRTLEDLEAHRVRLRQGSGG